MAPPPRPSTTPKAGKRGGTGRLLSLENLCYSNFSFPFLTSHVGLDRTELRVVDVLGTFPL